MTDHPIQHRDYYVYALFREDGQTPFYIGKGRGNRINIHEREARRFTSHKDRIIQNMHAAGIGEIPKMKLVEGLDDVEAKGIEVVLIQLIGRWPNGPLANLTKGGDGITDLAPESKARKSAANVASWSDPAVREKRLNGIRAAWTPERRAEHSAYKKANTTPEIRARMSAGRKRAWKLNPDPKNSDETRKRKSDGLKARWSDPEVRARCSAGIRKARSLSPRHDGDKERIQKIRELWKNPEWRANQIAVRKARHIPLNAEQRAASAARLNTPEARAKSKATGALPEVKARRSAAARAAFSTPEAKAKRSIVSKKMWARKKAQYALPSPKEIESQPLQLELPLHSPVPQPPYPPEFLALIQSTESVES